MRQIILIGLIAIVLLPGSNTMGQGIQFMQGSYREVLEKAKAENKKVFIDFYTTWCGPCKEMSSKVFMDADVAKYFNEKFISYQINAEDKAFATEVSRYEVTAYPTLVIADETGKLLGKQVGACDRSYFLKFAQSATGECLSFEAMYNKLKKEKQNDALVQDFLLEAPNYLVRQSGQELTRWELRVERVYKDYCKRKTTADWMNAKDFDVLQLFHTEAETDDPFLNYIMSHYDEVVQAVGEENVFRFVFTLHLGLIDHQARKGNMDYLKNLERVRGDMKQMYVALVDFGGKDVYTGLKYLYDGYYYIYAKKDVDKYIDLMEEYVKYLGQGIKGADYLAMVNAMSEALGESKDNKVLEKYIEWVTAALQFELTPDDKLNCMLMLGDCYKKLNNIELAKKCYNQAYVFSLQFGNPGLSSAVQQYIKELETLQ